MSEKLCASGHVISPGLERCRRCNSLAISAQPIEKPEEKPAEKPAEPSEPSKPKKGKKKKEPKAPAEEKDSFEKLLDEDKAKDEAEKVE